MKYITKEFPENVLESLFFRDPVDGYQLVRVGDFMSESKSDCCEFIFKETGSETLYRSFAQRYGEYHSDYDYHFDTVCDAVEPKQVTITTYVPVECDE